MKLFRDAFPAGSRPGRCQRKTLNAPRQRRDRVPGAGDLPATVVTRNTPFDRFLAGENGALTASSAARREAVLHPGRKPAGRGRLLHVPQRTDAQQAGRRPRRRRNRAVRRGELLQRRDRRPPGPGAERGGEGPSRPPDSARTTSPITPRNRAEGDHPQTRTMRSSSAA